MKKSNKAKKRKAKEPMVEIAGSFAYKVNPDNHLTVQERQIMQLKLAGTGYENGDFFLSIKGSCKWSDAEMFSEKLHSYCKEFVLKQVNRYIAELHQQAHLLSQGKNPLERYEDAKSSAQLDNGNQ